MKAKVIKIKKTLIISIILTFIFFICIIYICMDQIDIFSLETREVVSKVQANKVENSINIEIKNNVNTSLLKEYENFPKEYRGYQTVGKIKIPKLQIEKYILEETTEEITEGTEE